MLEDLVLEFEQCRCRVDTQTFGEPGTELAGDSERLRLTAVSIERQHQFGVQSLIQWMLGDERFQLSDHATVSAQFDVGLDAQLDGTQAGVVQSAHLRLETMDVGEIGIGATAPQCQRLAGEARCGGRVDGPLAFGVFDHPFEHGSIDRICRHPQPVSVTDPLDVVADHHPQIRDVCVDRTPQ